MPFYAHYDWQKLKSLREEGGGLSWSLGSHTPWSSPQSNCRTTFQPNGFLGLEGVGGLQLWPVLKERDEPKEQLGTSSEKA